MNICAIIVYIISLKVIMIKAMCSGKSFELWYIFVKTGTFLPVQSGTFLLSVSVPKFGLFQKSEKLQKNLTKKATKLAQIFAFSAIFGPI